MKSVKNLPPELKRFQFEEYSQGFDMNADERSFLKGIEEEDENDAKLDELAKECLNLYLAAQAEDRASKYWEIGDKILQYEKTLPKEKRRESFEKKSNYLNRISEKISQIIAEGKSDGKSGGLSLWHLRWIWKFRKFRRRSQVDDTIPWSIQFEYADLGKDARAWNRFISLYHSGKLTNKEKIRVAVDRYLKAGKLP